MYRLIRPFVPAVMTLFLAACVNAAEPKASQNIVQVAQGAGTFNTLLAAAQAAGLAEALAGPGPFTVFAPTDDAFAALPEGTVESLLLPENKDQLTAILKFHVVSGKVPSSAVRDGLEAATLNGAKLMFSVADGGVRVSGANIVAVDIEASNGVIHVIDSVLLPPAPKAGSRASGSSCGG